MPSLIGQKIRHETEPWFRVLFLIHILLVGMVNARTKIPVSFDLLWAMNYVAIEINLAS